MKKKWQTVEQVESIEVQVKNWRFEKSELFLFYFLKFQYCGVKFA